VQEAYLAKVVPSLPVKVALTAVDARLDGDVIADLELALVAFRQGSDDTSGFVAENERGLEDKGAVSA
jgi:hypothetical protein